MRRQPSRLWGFEIWCVLAALIGLGLWAMDTLTAPAPNSSASASGPPSAPGSGRMFILFVDSLRYQAAIDPHAMPHLAALREQSAWAEVRSSVDAVSTPAIRAAFTGRDRLSVFGFVKNFKKGREHTPSLFTQLRASGRQSAVYSDGTFLQFGDDIQTRQPNEQGDGTDFEQQRAAILDAADRFLQRRADLVLAHLTDSDHVAHLGGVAGPNYTKMLTRVDTLIGRLATRIPPQDTLVVFGDHGHDPAGRHATGLDVPTLIALRGPAYRPGYALPEVSITEYRYLLGWGLGLPLTTSYHGGRHPRALVSLQTAPSGAYGQTVPSPKTLQAAGIPARHQTRFWLCVLTLGLLAASSALRLDPKAPPAPLAAALGRVAFLPAFLGPASLLPLLASLSLAATALLLSAGHAAPKSRLGGLALVATFAAFTAWGHLLGAWRGAIHYPKLRVIIGYWILAMLASGLATARRGQPMRWVFWALAIPGLLAFPTVYRYGWPPILGPMLITWAVVMASVSLRPTTAHVATNPRLTPRLWLPLAGVTLFALPFILADSSNFSFDRWRGPTVPTAGGQWIALGLLAKAILFIRPKARPLDIALAAAAMALLICIQHGWLVLSPLAFVLLIGVAALCGLVGPRALPNTIRPHRAWLALVLALWLVFDYSIRVPLEAGYWLECLLAALYLAATWTRQHLQHAAQIQSLAFLVVMAALAAGWVGLGWGFYRLEWGFLYDWIAPDTAEAHVGALLPLIAGRYVFLFGLFGLVLSAAAPKLLARAAPLAIAVVAAKLFSLLGVTLGLGQHDTASYAYLEAVQELGILLTLSLGLVALPGLAPRWREAPWNRGLEEG